MSNEKKITKTTTCRILCGGKWLEPGEHNLPESVVKNLEKLKPSPFAADKEDKSAKA